MYKDYRKNRTEYLKLLNEGSVNPLNLDSKSNPALDIYNWDGKDELPTTIKSADLDAVVKKIVNKEDESGLTKTDVFESAYSKVFGNRSDSFRPYEDISDTDYKDSLMNSYKGYLSEESEDFKEKKEEESTDASKDLKMELDDIKSTENYDGEEEDEDDDDDDDEDSLKEAYMGLNLDENMGSDLDAVVNSFVNESEDYEDVSPISLLEDSEDSIFNLNSLLEQTQAIEDEVDSILSFNENEKFSNIMNENEIQDVLEENTDDYLLESDFSDDDFSDYLDEDLM